MSAIIKSQYETAKKLLALCEFNLRFYYEVDDSSKYFDIYYNNCTSLLTIVGGIVVHSTVLQDVRESRLSIIDNCRNRFAAYEAELLEAGLITSEWEKILADVEESTEPVEQIYTDDQKAQMWYDHVKNQSDYDSRR
jgi:hypothetical protein